MVATGFEGATLQRTFTVFFLARKLFPILGAGAPDFFKQIPGEFIS